MYVTAAANTSATTAPGQDQGQGQGPESGGCAAKCMAAKLDDAAKWFGPGNLASYCQHAEFITAYDTCLGDNCANHEELDAGKKSGREACAAAGVTSPGSIAPPTGHTPPTSGNNSLADLPAGATNHSMSTNSTPSATTTNSTLGGTLNNTLHTPNTTSTATNSRFSSAVNSAASAAANSTASTLTSSSILLGISSVLVIANL
ncbi:hypothetical protein BY996DRAFT_6425374 [Phakopsora pachyrhizi]|nr:hypothetical protein BY996DRAFT_6425374 [Phakopsora pachyrhizi]